MTDFASHLGMGKYDNLCTQARQRARAEGAILIIYGGNKGSGFSAQLSLALTARIPIMLRSLADSIEATMRGEETTPPN